MCLKRTGIVYLIVGMPDNALKCFNQKLAEKRVLQRVISGSYFVYDENSVFLGRLLFGFSECSKDIVWINS